MRSEVISRTVRNRFYYTVPAAGAQVGLGRSQSYRASELGQIPTERVGKFLLVPRKPWDQEVRRLLGRRTKRSRRSRVRKVTSVETATA